MKISYSFGNNNFCEKEQDWQPEECESKGGHCWVEYQSQYGTSTGNGSWFPPRERTCKHCGLRQELEIIHQENWTTKICQN